MSGFTIPRRLLHLSTQNGSLTRHSCAAFHGKTVTSCFFREIYGYSQRVTTYLPVLVRMERNMMSNLHAPEVYHYRLLISPTPTMT
ncbi:uncharacterized protein ARMOST_21307 [Armillaria ostoyae]|uniref:Uncharacterized protein n=1 Tax=Armillaria ostoyae TaxID=47428 RepID=A0A284S9T3_ARMOS|nr:uncharacterized protein ARMOST_21307 [Armillaria ostoyae]